MTDVEPQEPTEEVAPKVEEEAKVMGWVPKEEFKGDSDRWVEAEKFVARGKNELPIMRERMGKLTTTVHTLNGTVKNLKKTLGEFHEFNKNSREKEYDRALKDLSAKQRVAAEEGDIDTFDKVEEEKDTLLQEAQDEVVPDVDGNATDPELDEWIADGNDWFVNDDSLGAYAASISKYVASQNKDLTGKKFYDKVKEEVKARFPDKFGNTKRAAPTLVDSGADEAVPTPGKHTYANLPADAKQQCTRFLKEIPGFTKDDYVRDYEWE